MNWKELIPACFSDKSFEFASHTYEKQRAAEMFVAAINAGISMEQIVQEVRKCFPKDADINHIKRQIKIVRNLGI